MRVLVVLFWEGCGTWLPSSRDVYKLQMPEDKSIRKIFGPKKD
jgi:hypothetical protein